MHLEQPGLFESIKLSVKNKPFVFSAIIFLFTWLTIDILQTMLLYFIKYAVNREGNSDLIMATIFVVAIIALPLWTWTSRRLQQAPGIHHRDGVLCRRVACDDQVRLLLHHFRSF